MTETPTMDNIRQIGAWLTRLTTVPDSGVVASAAVGQGPLLLPEPGMVRRTIRHRQMRSRFFSDELFADPAWDILLDLTAACVERRKVSVSSVCIAAGVPATTALRWIGIMVDGGLLNRLDDKADRRRAFISLTDKAIDAMARYFTEVGTTMDYLA